MKMQNITIEDPKMNNNCATINITVAQFVKLNRIASSTVENNCQRMKTRKSDKSSNSENLKLRCS